MAVGLFWNDRVSFEKHEWAKRFFFLGNNTGNLVFIRALKDIFHPVMIPLWDVTSDTFRDRADITHYITTELIWLTPNQTYPHVWTMLKRIGDKPLVPISVGVQSMARNVDITLHPDTVKLLRTMAERAVLGVRGEYTAAVLEKNPNVCADLSGLLEGPVDLDAYRLPKPVSRDEREVLRGEETVRPENARVLQLPHFLRHAVRPGTAVFDLLREPRPRLCGAERIPTDAGKLLRRRVPVPLFAGLAEAANARFLPH